ncbi:MAG: SH3 domain-containing protein [Anaerolineales bacterium]|nr:SH3 domain-containing protein [Anaerolineales bacterium]
MAKVIGPDVSFYQDDPETPQGINFTRMRQHAQFVIVRAGQNLWGDRDFKANWRGAKAAGLPRGSYWFYDSRIDPKQQAEKWVSMFEGDFGELPLFGDFEDTYNGGYRGWKHWYDFLERVKQLIPSNKEIGVYTGYYYWLENTVGVSIPTASLNYFKQYPLWIAAYNPTGPSVPKPWDDWTLWQFTDNGDGAVYGVESLNIDLNYFNGDEDAFEQRFGVTLGPAPEPTPPGKNYRVTVNSLKVRSGPGLSFGQIGSIKLNEVVERLESNPDETWHKIRKLDGSLTGWSFAAYLQNLGGTPSGGDTGTGGTGGTGSGGSGDPGSGTTNPPPDEEDTDWYRVTASTLKIRIGPGLEFESIGTFTFGELVEKLDASPDNKWLRVRSKDGRKTGWSFGDYLISVHNPSSEPPPSTTVPDYNDKNWYKVTTSTLNLRESPNLTAKIISTLSKNDIIPALDESNSNWVKTQKLDGSTGWCSRDYLAQVGTAKRPDSVTQALFSGVTYLRKDLTSPRPIVVHVLAIDLQAQKLEFLVTPSANNTDVLCTRTTSKFLEEFKLHAAINGGYFSYLDASFIPSKLCPNGGDPVRISDYAASRGKIYSNKKTAQPVIHIGKKNQVIFNPKQPAVFNAISGDRLVVVEGKVVKNLAAQVPNPRTAVGLSKNGRWLTLMVVDGRQAGYSEGVTFPELAELLISYGVYTGANMDGGGSSSMVIRGFDGKARVLNSPIEMNQPGKERPVGNHLGLFIKP